METDECYIQRREKKGTKQCGKAEEPCKRSNAHPRRVIFCGNEKVREKSRSNQGKRRAVDQNDEAPLQNSGRRSVRTLGCVNSGNDAGRVIFYEFGYAFTVQHAVNVVTNA